MWDTPTIWDTPTAVVDWKLALVPLLGAAVGRVSLTVFAACCREDSVGCTLGQPMEIRGRDRIGLGVGLGKGSGCG